MNNPERQASELETVSFKLLINILSVLMANVYFCDKIWYYRELL
jgi:hypothetical protein